MTEHFSDEQLNAYLDNQLDREERIRILEALPHDNELAARLCKLQKVQDMVQLAYHNVSTEQSPVQKTPGQNKLWPAMAASVLLVAGLVTGWFAHNQFNQSISLLELAKSVQTQQLAVNQDEWRLMLHVNSGDAKKFKVMLAETEQLLKASQQNNQNIRIEILTNGPGLDLFKETDTPYVNKLQQLAKQYDNLDLLACQKAINRLKVEKGIDIDLIPEAQVVESAMHQVIKRQQEGWSYINI